MTVDENVKKAMGRIDRYLAGWRICQTPWQIIRTRLIELEALLADYENANKHSADDCVAKDGEDYAAIDRVAHVLQEVIAENDGEPSEMAHDQMRRILAAYAAPSAPTENAGVPDSVIVLLNHLETLMDEGKLAEDAIPTEMWNAVSMHNLVAAPSAPEGGHIDRARFKKAPCYLCGYNGPGYYQPKTHSCADKYHAAALEGDGGGE